MLNSVVSLIIALHLSIPVGKAITLTYNMKVGDRFELKQKTDQKIIQRIMGMDQTGNNTYDGTIEMRVVSVANNQIRMEAKMTHLKSHMKNFLNETKVDSDGDVSEPSNKIIRAMMNRAFFVTISKTGTVEKVENVENLWAGIDNVDVSDEEKEKVKASIGQMINESSFRNGLGQAFVPYATKSVQPGDTWNSQNGIPADFPVVADVSWSLDNATSSHAVVKGNGVFRTTDKDKVVTLPGDMKAKVNLGGDQKVNATTATRSGLPEKVVVDAKLSGTILLLAGGLLPMDVEVPITIETHTDYTFAQK
ncbi:DUF6263 family protein [Chryseolinea sp. T2]|uniref:DUF6263 family protein n=1 Tax=Chryseolinea sp. T2 TaxID=3129255 RepID=UPI003077B4F6